MNKTASGGEPDDFEFGRTIDRSEKFVYPEHGRVLQFRIAALDALEHWQRLEDHY